MKFSVITPVKNGSATIRACQASVRMQTKPVEHVIVDGSSSDGTLEILQESFGPHDLLLKGFDRGIYDAINGGIRASSGDIIGILNADDVLAAPRCIEALDYMFESEGFDIVYGDLVYVLRDDLNKIQRYWRAGEFKRGKLRFGWMPPHPTFYVRRSVYQSIGDYSSDFGSAADYELMLRALLAGSFRVGYLPRILVKMRLGGVSNQSISSRLRAHLMDWRAWRKHAKRFELGGTWIKPLRKLPQFIRRPQAGAWLN